MLTIFGAAAVTLMMICYALEPRHRAWTLAFALTCFAASAYGWLAGTWPFGAIEAVWGVVALQKWYRRRPSPQAEPSATVRTLRR
jgi:hypothetical protein